MTAEPIWHPRPSPSYPRVYLRRQFVLTSGSAASGLHCACSGPYAVYLNGELVGRSPGPALTGCPVWEEQALGGFLRAGPNVLLMVAGGGWPHGDAEWFAAAGEVSDVGGQHLGLNTGDGWMVQRSEAWQAFELGALCGVHLAVHEPQAWTLGGFREEAWTQPARLLTVEPRQWRARPAAAVEVWAQRLAAFGEVETGGGVQFVQAPWSMDHAKCVRREAVLRPGRQQALIRTRVAERGVYLVLDFGRVIAGFPRLRLRAGEDSVVDLGFARRWGQVESGLRYVAASGKREWTGHRLETCRYLVVRLSHWQEEGELDCVSLVQRTVQVPTRGDFDGGGGFGEMWEIGAQSAEACRQETYHLATPTVAFSWLTAWAMALDDFYLTGDLQTAGATLAGRLPPTPEQGVEQCAGYALLAEAYVRYGGDRDQIRPLLPGVLQGLAVLGERSGAALSGSPDWHGTGACALLVGALEAAGRVCRWLGDKEGRSACQQQRSPLLRALQQAWDEEGGLFADAALGEPTAFSQWTNGLLLLFGAATGEQQERMVRQVWGPVVTRVEDLTQAFTVAGGLWRAGADREALAWVDQHWGRLLAREGAAWGEKRLNGPPDPAPGPEFYLGAEVLGVRPRAPGYRLIEVRPQLSGLEHVRGRLLTSVGPVVVEWRHQEGRALSLRMEVPAEAESRLAVPRLGLRFPSLTLNREVVWRNEKVYPNSFVHEVISEPQRIVLVLHRGGAYEVLVE